jgi:ABC-type polysaccharide/polyol phosphate export permease
MPTRSLSWRQKLRIVLALGWSDFVLKYRGSVLGYFWSFAAPFVQFIVILTVFRPVVGNTIPHYALYLFLGLILWEFFLLTTSACIAVPLQKMALMQKVSLPRTIFIYSVGWTHLVIFLTRFVLFVLFALLSGVLPTVGWWALPLLLLQMTLLSLGVGMLLGAYALQYRDIAHLWGVTLQILFWLTPIVYDASRSGSLTQEFLHLIHASSFSLSSIIHTFITFQPLSIFIFDARRLLLPGSILPSPLHLLLFTLLCAVFYFCGLLVFRRQSRYFLQQY